MKKSLVSALMTAFGCTLSLNVAQADTTMSHTGLMMKEPAVIWTSGLKQRKEMSIPFVGKLVVITRVDKGVEWTLNEKKKTYTETPIALPYHPMEKEKPTQGNGEDSPMGDEDESGEKCTPEMVSLSATHTFAGLKSKGYRIGCKENPKEGMTIWQADASALTKQAQADLKTFGVAYSKAQFKNYPAKERATMEKGFSMWGSLLNNLPAMLGMEKIPEGMWVATEAESADSGNQLIYKLESLTTSAIAADKFEIPAGYKKAAAAANPMGSFGDIDINEAMKGLIPTGK